MKKHFKKILFTFIILLSAFYIYSEIAGDPFTWIGSSRIRSDEDTNVIRFNKMLYRDLNAQLFLFNSNHFQWSTSTGLNLKPNAFGDSVMTNMFTIHKDTIHGETTWDKYWTLKRTYFKENDSTVLIWYFRNTQFGSPLMGVEKEFYAINKCDELARNKSSQNLSETPTHIFSTNMPHYGQWRLELFFNYLFEFIKYSGGGSDVSDSIFVYFTSDAEGENIIADYTITIPYPDGVYAGQKGTGYLSAIYTDAIEVHAWAVCSNNSTARKYITGIHTRRELIR